MNKVRANPSRAFSTVVFDIVRLKSMTPLCARFSSLTRPSAMAISSGKNVAGALNVVRYE
jgi:hypothetical protein